MNQFKSNTAFALIGFLFVSICGTLFHFAYHFFEENFLAGLFFPVNESAWEHMKLIFFPMLIYGYIGRDRKFLDSDMLWKYAYCTLYATWLIPCLFYTYQGILGFANTVLDILVFFVSVLLGFLWFFIHNRHNTLSILTSSVLERILFLLVGIQLFCFLLFSYLPPALGIFLSPK